ncbi:hypothetical protein BJQ94_06990 [Cryobacterium sp. SO2]|uniref:hypothetical protein n=1 Tax=Cryobacterium sp. SO2 TaxID=1897060 RepID=UPI00223CE3A1|nr:hypothetical protein [Cryobacterium sp. SO2]WEO78768.1 hypothetical protein BJQ94_06990 [Cryobacterium sp. SO2]
MRGLSCRLTFSAGACVMTNIRLIQSFLTVNDLSVGPDSVLTSKLSDESYQGGWRRAKNPMVIFSDHNMDGARMTHHGGTVAGTAGGVPVQLLFWGTWWTGAGAASRVNIEAQTQRLLASRYFAELYQYGIPHAPVWRGSLIVTSPSPPASGTTRETMRATLDLIDDLLDDNVFPDPDDGPRIAFIVLLPDGYVVTNMATVAGAHGSDYDSDGPFDTDTYWAGWVRHLDPVGAAPNNTVETLAHELIEIVTDPEFDGWHTERNTPNNELVDAGGSPAPGQASWTSNFTLQSAFTDDVRVQAYWSNAHWRTVIPLTDVYLGRLRAKLQETSRRRTAEGSFRPAAGGLSFCVEDREYWWRTFDVDERIRVRIDAQGFHTMRASAWTLNGVAVPGLSGVLRLPMTVRGYSGMTPDDRAVTVKVTYQVQPSGIDLDVASGGGSFGLRIGCTLTDADITGNILSQPTVEPFVEVGVRGTELEIDPSYTDQYERCLKQLLKQYIERYDPMRRPRPGDPPVFDVGIIRERQPIFTSQTEWLRATDVARGIGAAFAMMDVGVARAYTASLLEGLPSVGSQLSVEDVERLLHVEKESEAEPARGSEGPPAT